MQFLAVFGFFLVGLRYLLLILGYSPLKAAVALIPVAVLVIPVSLRTPRLLDRFGPRGVIPAGLLGLADGLLWISQLTASSGYPPFLGGLLIAGAGLGLAGQAGTASIISSLSLRQQGVASAVNDTTREVGSAVGIALMSSVFATRYIHTLPASITALPATVRTAVRQSPEADLAAARLGGPHGAQLVHAIRDSFMNGLSGALLAACAILAAAAIGAALRAPTASQPSAQATRPAHDPTGPPPLSKTPGLPQALGHRTGCEYGQKLCQLVAAPTPSGCTRSPAP